MARGEGLDVDAARLDEGLGLGGEPLGAVEAGAHVERVDADRVARGVQLARRLVQQHEREVAVEHRGGLLAVHLVQVHDALAVAARAEPAVDLRLALDHVGAKLLVVVDLAVDGERRLHVVREEGLVARQRVDDREALVSNRRCLSVRRPRTQERLKPQRMPSRPTALPNVLDDVNARGLRARRGQQEHRSCEVASRAHARLPNDLDLVCRKTYLRAFVRRDRHGVWQCASIATSVHPRGASAFF